MFLLRFRPRSSHREIQQEETERLNVAGMSDEKTQDMLRRKLLVSLTNHENGQNNVLPAEVEKSMAEGWEWIGKLTDRRAILRLP